MDVEMMRSIMKNKGNPNFTSSYEVEFPDIHPSIVFPNQDISCPQVPTSSPFYYMGNQGEDDTATASFTYAPMMGAHASYLSSVEKNSTAAIREMIFRIASMQPINIDPETVKPPKRRNVRISKDPQSVAARHRREKISEKIRILQRIVPGGTKMDTASMLDEAIHYVKFLKQQIKSLEGAGNGTDSYNGGSSSGSFVVPNLNYGTSSKNC